MNINMYVYSSFVAWCYCCCCLIHTTNIPPNKDGVSVAGVLLVVVLVMENNRARSVVLVKHYTIVLIRERYTKYRIAFAQGCSSKGLLAVL